MKKDFLKRTMATGLVAAMALCTGISTGKMDERTWC